MKLVIGLLAMGLLASENFDSETNKPIANKLINLQPVSQIYSAKTDNSKQQKV